MQDDSDYQVCLSSSQYNRILTIEKQCSKQREQFSQLKLKFAEVNDNYTKEVNKLTNSLKAKTSECDQLSIQCLRLKKIRLMQQDQIKNLKESQSRNRQLHLSQFEMSTRQNQQVKQKIGIYQQNINDLKELLLKMKSENIDLNDKINKKAKDNKIQIEKYQNQLDELKKEHSEAIKKAEYFKKKSQGFEADIKSIKLKSLQIQKQMDKLNMINEQSTIKYKQELDHHTNMKNSLQMQLKIAKQQQQELVKEKQQKVSTLRQQNVRLAQLLLEANNKMDQLIEKPPNNNNPGESKQKSNQQQKFSAKILEILEWSKQGVLSQKQLKQQISNILAFQKQYEQIIKNNLSKIQAYQKQVQMLRQANNQLLNNNNNPYQQNRPNSNNQNNELLTQNMILKQKIDKLKHQMQSTVKSYNQLLSESQIKFQNQLKQYRQIHNQMQAIKLNHEYQNLENREGVQLFNNQLLNMRQKSIILNPPNVMDAFKKIFPKLSQ